LASFPTDPDFDLSIDANYNWWMGEKYDGIRCCWHADRKILYSRQRKKLLLRPKLIEALPSVFMDCELWFGRGNFSYSYIFIKGVSDFIQWHSLRMLSFDNPVRSKQSKVFEQRYRTLLDSVSHDHPFSMVVSRVKCTNLAHVSKAVQSIIDEEGEGIILRKCNSVYEHGRSHNLIKLKAAHGDQEGIVVGVGDDGSTEVKMYAPH
jgi:DNA ligase-1